MSTRLDAAASGHCVGRGFSFCSRRPASTGPRKAVNCRVEIPELVLFFSRRRDPFDAGDVLCATTAPREAPCAVSYPGAKGTLFRSPLLPCREATFARVHAAGTAREMPCMTSGSRPAQRALSFSANTVLVITYIAVTDAARPAGCITIRRTRPAMMRIRR